jgi:hypothetical protein
MQLPTNPVSSLRALVQAPQPDHIALDPGKKMRVPPVTAATTIIFEQLKLEALL